jgi:hypothetical protein
MIRWTALAFAASAIAAPAGMAYPVVGDGPGYSGLQVPAAPKLITDAYNRTAVTSTGGGFDWMYVEVGIGALVGLAVLAGGTVIVIRRSGEPKLLGA